jgi:hypothetical protein
MSINLSPVAQQEFDNEVTHAYQGMQTLRSCVTLRTGVVGDAYKFRRMGSGVANQKPTQADVTPMNIGHDLITCTLQNWVAPEYTDIFDQAEVNFDEKMELARSIGHALGRRDDQMILDAIAYTQANDSGSDGVASSEATNESYYSDIGADFGLDTLLEARRYFDTIEITPDVPITCVAHPLDYENLIAEEKTGRMDYNTVRTLVETPGMINNGFLGFNYKKIGTRAGEGGIVATGDTDRWVYFFAQNAIGMAVGLDIRTEINYVPEKTSWLCNGIFKANAVTKMNRGIACFRVTA